MRLKKFLNAPANTVTRERMFFNKLYFDLKLAAARAEYHLSVFEPEVDRDKFDVLLDDGDNERRIQLKALTKSSGTKRWSSTKRFLRPDLKIGSKLNVPPADCGIGGGFILIEIDDASEEAPVSYYFTDRSIIYALEAGLLREANSPPTRRGKPPQDRRKLAQTFLNDLASGEGKDAIELHKRLFIRIKSADALLAIAGFHSKETCYLPVNHLLEAEIDQIVVDEDGLSSQGLDRSLVAAAHARLSDIVALLDEPELFVFDRRQLTQ